MAHPMNEHRQHHVEKRRVHHIAKGYASGGAVEENDKKSVEKSVRKGEMRAEGKLPKHRMDKRARGGKVGLEMHGGGKFGRGRKDGDQPTDYEGDRQEGKGTERSYAKGGRTRHGGKTVVNVIAGGHPGMGAPPMMPPAGPPPAMPPRPPMAAPPGAMPGAMPPGGGMPPMGPRARGGRAYASGGAVKDGPTWKEGVRNGTQVQHSPGKSDTANIGRSKVVTYKTGGAVEASNKVEPATKLPGGSGGARARLAKEKAYHGKPGGLYS